MKYFRGIYFYEIYFNGFHGLSLSHIFFSNDRLTTIKILFGLAHFRAYANK